MRLVFYLFILDEAFSPFAVYQDTGCSVWFQFSFNCRVSVQAFCGLWGWYPVSSWVNWAWKECLCHADEETPFHSAAIFTPWVAWRAGQWHWEKKNKLFFKMLALNLPQDSSDLAWPLWFRWWELPVTSTAERVWMKNPDINVWMSALFWALCVQSVKQLIRFNNN